MAKTEVVWLIVRLAGVYLLWEAFGATVGFVASVGLFGVVAGAHAMPDNSGFVLLAMFLKAAFYSLLGFYWIGNGRLLFRVLNRQSIG